MSHRFCSTRIRSHPLARFALYRMVGTGGGYTGGAPNLMHKNSTFDSSSSMSNDINRKSRLMINLFTLASKKVHLSDCIGTLMHSIYTVI